MTHRMLRWLARRGEKRLSAAWQRGQVTVSWCRNPVLYVTSVFHDWAADAEARWYRRHYMR